jgi:hypothetical protein
MNAEQEVSRLIRLIVDKVQPGEDFASSEHFNDLSSALDYFVPAVLSEVYPEWKRESLDGIVPYYARVTGKREVEIFGLCVLILDGRAAPIHLQLQVAPSTDELCWMECRLGELQEERLQRTPGDQLNVAMKRLYCLERGADDIVWVYKVTFGQKC